MRVLIVDQGAVGLAIAYRCAQFGHKVFWYVEDKPGNYPEEVGKDYHKNIEKVTNWVSYVPKVDLTISTENGAFIEKLDSFKRRGHKVYTPSKEAVELEINRGKGMAFLEDHGIEVPEYHTFKSLAEVEKFVRNNPGPWVLKPEGDNENKALSFVSKNDGELLNQLAIWKEQKQQFTGSIILQKKIEGIEFAVCAWVGSEGFIGPFSESWEHKKLMPKDHGPNTGEMGTVIKYVKESKLGEMVLRPLEEDLAEMGAFCSCDVNCIIDEDGQPWPLEFTMRFGWPATNIQIFTHKGDPVQFMLDALDGEDTLEVDYDVAIGVVLAIPDFPYGNFKEEQVMGLPIYGITEENDKNVQPQSMKMAEMLVEEDGEIIETVGYVTAGDYVAVIVDTGETVEAAQKAVYKIADEISIPNKIQRSDIGDRVIKKLPELQQMGFASGWGINNEEQQGGDDE
jgi:phosphoribosylamine---glycine ligase